MRRFRPLILPLIFWVMAMSAADVRGQEKKTVPANGSEEKLSLVEKIVCEDMKGNTPVNGAVVFSSDLEKIYCLTSFDPVPREMVIYHEWYRRDELKAKVRLTLKPPRWSSFSSMHIRSSDQGPWRITITDQAGKILGTVRFSITE
jgi:hypothetical protein